MSIRPVDLPLLRDETAAYVLRSGPEVYERAIRDGRQFMKPVASPTRGAAILAAAEVKRLKEAELFHVSADMTDLAAAAGVSLPAFNLMPEDLPAPSGFILFEKPIAAVDYADYYENEGASPIVAASWSEWTPEGWHTEWKYGGLWITWYADREGMLRSAVERGLCTEAQARTLRGTMPRIAVDNESQCAFSPEPLPVASGQAEAVNLGESLINWMHVVKATWLLMAQPMADVRDAVYDRAARRRIQRQHKEPPRVRVITLRRPKVQSSGQTDREFHHQWVVRGHWRQQWYSSREVHRPVWIAPHIKGPEGAPMLGGEKVYAWQR